MALSVSDFEGLEGGWSKVQRESEGNASVTQLNERLEKLRLYIERFTEDNPSGIAFQYEYSAEKITEFQKIETGVKAVICLDRLEEATPAMRSSAYRELGDMIQNVEAVFNSSLSLLNKNLNTFAYQQGKIKFGLDENLVAVKLGKRRKLAEMLGKKLPTAEALFDKLNEIERRLTPRELGKEMTLTSLEKRTLIVINDAIKRLRGNKNGN